jgi:hypothetical protein
MAKWRGVTQVERFWKNVDKRGSEECWPWKGRPNCSGYGRLHFDGRVQRAHRVSCDNPICVNPNHLDVRTHAENMGEIADKGRRKRKLTDVQIGAVYASRGPAEEVARKYEISAAYVYKIRRHYVPGMHRSYS